jgi:hypothetical protein
MAVNWMYHKCPAVQYELENLYKVNMRGDSRRRYGVEGTKRLSRSNGKWKRAKKANSCSNLSDDLLSYFLTFLLARSILTAKSPNPR